jgi:uncharacterized protein (TIGR00255 family)
MIFSMTAFSRVAKPTEFGNVQWEIRSVNQRFLDIHFRLHESMRHLEVPLREKLRARLQRGKIEVALYFHPQKTDKNHFAINHDLVDGLIQAHQQLAEKLGTDNQLSPMQLLQWQGVLEQPEADTEARDALILSYFDEAIDTLIAARGREGDSMKALLVERIEQIAEKVALVREQMPDILAWQKQRLLDRFEDLQAKVDQERIEQEMVFLAQKTDVAEELDRLDTHVTEITRILNKGGTVGRRLDFLIQELNREANTLSAKSISKITTTAAVDIKVLIEQMREQVQNIE